MTVRGSGRPDAYRLADGTRVPSVTTITGARKTGVEGLLSWANRLGLEGKSHKEAREEAANAGTLAHQMVENAIHGQDCLTGIDRTDLKLVEMAYGGFTGFQSWQNAMGIDYLMTEEPMVSETLRYGGTPDAIGRTKSGELALLDWKSSNAVYGDYIIQLAAYHALWNEQHEEKIQVCYLLRFGKEHGDFHFHHYPESVIQIGWDAFLHLRALYDLDRQLKKVAT